MENQEKHEVKISDYCKECYFLCKTDKEYCPNKMDYFQAKHRYELAQLKRLREIDKTIKEEN